jgi:hypothetical protein
MSKITKVWLKNTQMAGTFRGTHPLFYETNLETVENVIRHWYAGDIVLPDKRERIRTTGSIHLDNRIRDTKLTFLKSNDFEIGMNFGGTRIACDLTVGWLHKNSFAKSLSEMEEALNHVAMVKELYPDINLWPPEVWYLFPQTTNFNELIIPF